MAKLEKASEDIIEFITKIIIEHGLDAFATFRFFELPKQKEFIKVNKANATSEFFAKTSDLCTVFVNPRIWDRLDEQLRHMLVENALSGIHYEEKENGTGRLVVEQPNLLISSGCYAVFGKQLVDAAEIAYHAFEQIKEEDKKEKEAKKASKKRGFDE